MADPASILVWVGVVTEILTLAGKLGIIGQRIKDGEDITQEELDILKQEAVTAIDRWKAAAIHDKE